MSASEPPFVSVVIPVFNQPEALARCLAGLARQTYRADRFEALVIDNGSAVSTRDLVEGHGFARWSLEAKPGSYAARNHGVGLARGAVLAFTDADCVPAESWVERGARAIDRLPGAGLVAGKIDLVFADPDRLTAAELFESIFGFPQETFVDWGFSATANLFTSREAWQRVGPFDGDLRSGGDMEWGQRLRAHGLAQAYDGDVRVAHPARRTLAELLRKSIRVAGGVQDVAERRGEGVDGLLLHARRQLLQLWKIRESLADGRLRTMGDKLKLAAAVWLVELVQTVERYRVHYGGRSRRI